MTSLLLLFSVTFQVFRIIGIFSEPLPNGKKKKKKGPAHSRKYYESTAVIMSHPDAGFVDQLKIKLNFKTSPFSGSHFS